MSNDDDVRRHLEAGDVTAAATAAIRRFGPDVLRYLRSVLRDEDEAADAFSVFAENLWRGLPSLRERSSLRTWAFRIAWNAALNLRNEPWRRRGRRFDNREASALVEEIRTKTVVRVARQEQALDEMRKALSIEDQALLALRVDQRLSWTEIAEVFAEEGTEVEPATLMKRFERIKTRLREIAQEQGLLG